MVFNGWKYEGKFKYLISDLSVINKESFWYEFMVVSTICIRVMAEYAKNDKKKYLGQITKKSSTATKRIRNKKPWSLRWTYSNAFSDERFQKFYIDMNGVMLCSN